MKEVGFYMGTTEDPQKDGKKYTVSGFEKNFQYETDVLEPATTYYYVAYAENEKGIAYGDVMKFATRKAGVAPNIAIVSVSPFATSAQVSCSASKPELGPDQSLEPFVEKGICYSEKENPTVDDIIVVAEDNLIVDFVATMNDLKENATYYVRAYAKVFGSTIYSNQEKVTTTSLSAPEVKTVSVDKIGGSGATVTSELTVQGGSENLVLGVRVYNEELKFDSIYVTSNALNADNTFETKVNRLQKETKYFAQAYAKNEAGEVFGEPIAFTTTTFGCGDEIEDHEGNTYPTVELGAQCWMAQNLRVKTWPDGTEIAEGFGNDEAANATIDGPAFLFTMPNGKINDERIGYYYNFSAFMAGEAPSTAIPSGVRGICPEGWHIPSAPELKQLRDYLLTTEYNYMVGSYTDIHNSLAMPNAGYNKEPEKPCGFNLIAIGYYDFKSKNQAEMNVSSRFVSCSKSTTEGNYWYVYSRPDHNRYCNWMDQRIDGSSYDGCSYADPAAVRCILNQDASLPMVKTAAAEIDKYDRLGAMLKGQVISTGNTELTESGFFFGKDEDPIANGEKLVAADVNTLQYELPTLDPTSTYYYAAYATNKVGTAYGEVMSFTTREAGQLPTVETASVTPYATSADVTGNLVSDGGEKILEKGFCYGEEKDPSIETGTVVKVSLYADDFQAELKDLKANTTYYVRAYATNTVGTTYGNSLDFTTTSVVAPEVKTISVDEHKSSSVTATGKLMVQGGDKTIDYGFVCDTVAEPVLETAKSAKATKLNADSTFTATVAGLSASTTYYVRAYAKNAAGEVYGEAMTFTTDSGFACGTKVMDANGNIYNTVQIGSQCWMKENIISKTYTDGTDLSASDYVEYDDPTIGKVMFYTWTAATRLTSSNMDLSKKDIQGICPDGWYVPCYDEWNTLCKTVDPEYQEVTSRPNNKQQAIESKNGLAIKLSSPIGWENSTTPNTPGYYTTDTTGFNTTGFSVLPIGYANPTVYCPGGAHFWTSVGGGRGTKNDIFKVTPTGTGVTWQTNASASTLAGVRCVKGADKDPVDPEPIQKVCKATMTLEGPGWNTAEDVIFIAIDEEGNETEIFHENGAIEGRRIEASGVKFVFMVKCESYSPEEMHFDFQVIDEEGIGNGFPAEMVFDRFREARGVMFIYGCGDKEPEAKAL